MRRPPRRAETEPDLPLVAEHPTEDALLALSEGRASGSERKSLLAHLHGCAECRELLSAFSGDVEQTRVDDPLIGTVLDGYRVRQLIARGGMGAVYLGLHPSGTRVALKVALSGVGAQAFARMRAEARALASVSHPNVVGVLAFGALDDGRPYVVMEYLAGETLSHALRRGAFPLPRALAVLDQMLAGLSACHAQRVLHRDLKPSNVLLHDGAAKLIDFGLARQDEATALTASSTLMGSVGYLAPELLQGHAASEASDLYAVGCIAWELLTGAPVFRRDGSPAEVLRRHLTQTPPRLPQSLSAAGLDTWLARMLAREPEQRWPSAEVARAQLKRLSR